eukprot:CAMPEP_0176490692 /NCGR_PEP_ID=MMETSP0200_2-20121128/8008_1 /TAXON_ID=947934 /ORGANISM="Chaetoceros sp., Strain GSL56" /LENGTH=682 /DNA_ID=CAMNT_0017888019 /DNA_START=200 /DNA_END=2248 /DNA_ORIENTATION=+
MLPYFLSEFKTQLISVGPITVVLTLTVIASRQRIIDDFWETILGMLCAVIGLTFFLFGLKGSIMPLAEKVGTLVNEKFSLPVVLFISFVLGILVTLAEPAVSSLRPLGREVDRFRAPYLYYMMNDGVDWLLLSIGIGVGIAAIVGTARFVYAWPFKPLAIGSTSLCITVSALVYFLEDDLRPVIALAWDAGAVTTGPVTVPVLLALGKGAVRFHSSRQETDSTRSRRPPMQGFGLVTLASLYPIICVHFYALIVYFNVDKESIQSSVTKESNNAVDRPPVREIVTAIRSITPLAFVLIVIMKVFLRTNLPSVRMKDIHRQEISQAPVLGRSDTTDSSQHSKPASCHGVTPKSNSSHLRDNQKTFDSDLEESPQGVKNLDESCDSLLSKPKDIKCFQLEIPETAALKKESEENENLEQQNGVTVVTQSTNYDPHENTAREKMGLFMSACRSYMARECIFYESLLASQVGLILFNIGLHYGFTSLGDQVGSLLPAFYSKVENDSDSPIMSKAGGTAVANLFIFLLGILATRAEPGLKVLAEQVKTLTNGVMKKTKTIYSVALGVGIGMVAGTSRLQLDTSIFPYLAVMYSMALVLTIFSPEIVAKVAWDSAGVTTGPVTVPFVLSIGLSYARARLLPSGFGILSCASVGPIISVLFAFLPCCGPKKAASTEESSNSNVNIDANC